MSIDSDRASSKYCCIICHPIIMPPCPAALTAIFVPILVQAFTALAAVHAVQKLKISRANPPTHHPTFHIPLPILPFLKSSTASLAATMFPANGTRLKAIFPHSTHHDFSDASRIFVSTFLRSCLFIYSS